MKSLWSQAGGGSTPCGDVDAPNHALKLEERNPLLSQSGNFHVDVEIDVDLNVEVAVDDLNMFRNVIIIYYEANKTIKSSVAVTITL